MRIVSQADIDLWIKARDIIEHAQRPGWTRPDAGNGHDEFDRMTDLVQRGLLRSYFLKAGDEYLGYISGCQYRDAYYMWTTNYNKRYAHFSPGATMLYLAIEDLLGYRPVKIVKLGFGDPGHLFPNQYSEQYSSVVLLRKTFSNRFHRANHWSFRTLVGFARHLLKSNPNERTTSPPQKKTIGAAAPTRQSARDEKVLQYSSDS